tara:strand:- start:1193 stop:1459 length:267 start_codon:yes stop_codon:yes gene_type:complete
MFIPEESLYIAVISQAMKDAIGIAGDPDINNHPERKEQAENWFNLQDDDFLYICETLSVKPTNIINMLEDLRTEKKNFNQRFKISRTY